MRWKSGEYISFGTNRNSVLYFLSSPCYPHNAPTPGSHSDAFCETTITWDTGVKKYKTRGLDTDQTVAAIKATEKMLNT